MKSFPGSQDVGWRGPARITADNSCSHVSPGELVSILFTRLLEPGHIRDLTFDHLIPHHPLHVTPVFWMAVVRQSDCQPHEVHQGAGFARDDIAFAADDLGEKTKTGAL